MVRLEGFVLSSRFARCRDADSLVFNSVRLFESRKYAPLAYFQLFKSIILQVLPLHFWCAWRDSNPRRTDSKSDALSTELQAQFLKNGVRNGVRTRGPRNHNPVLYQLSYSHHLNFQIKY